MDCYMSQMPCNIGLSMYLPGCHLESCGHRAVIGWRLCRKATPLDIQEGYSSQTRIAADGKSYWLVSHVNTDTQTLNKTFTVH